MTTRRQFITTVSLTAFAAAATRAVAAQAARIEETDPQAVALGYRQDATKVDVKKYPKYAAGQACATCQLFQGSATDPWAPCGVMGGKLVNAKGWCIAWVKKA